MKMKMKNQNTMKIPMRLTKLISYLCRREIDGLGILIVLDPSQNWIHSQTNKRLKFSVYALANDGKHFIWLYQLTLRKILCIQRWLNSLSNISTEIFQMKKNTSTLKRKPVETRRKLSF